MSDGKLVEIEAREVAVARRWMLYFGALLAAIAILIAALALSV
jgi:hypothetical protein